MARIRTIKPDFFTSADTMHLSAPARLLYIGLWCEADREGRLAWRPSALKVRYLPYDAIDIDTVCAELLAGGLVVRYGDDLAYVPTFLKHQVINNKETSSKLPSPDEARVIDASQTRESRVTGEGKEGKGKEGKEGEGKGMTAAVAAFPAPVQISNDAWQETIADWNRAVTGTGLPDVSSNPASRQRIIAAIKVCPDLGIWQRRYERVAQSVFCRGTNDRGWKADFWWVLEHGDAIDAGRYDNRPDAKAKPEDDYWSAASWAARGAKETA